MSTATIPDVTDRYTTNLVRRTAQAAINKGFFGQDDLEDLTQDLTLALLEARDNFNSEEYCWTTYVNTVVSRRIHSLCRKQTAAVRGGKHFVGSLDGGDEDDCQGDDDGDSSCHQPIAREHRDFADFERSEDLAVVLRRLTAEQRELCELLKTHSIAEAARRLDIPRSTAVSRLAKIREVFRAAGFDGAC